MSTQPQIHANRLNAQKSTGPKTRQGKAAVAQNALKHGLSAHQDVIITETQADFDLHREALIAELDPQTPMESILADRIVSLSWRLKRADRIQNQTIDAMDEKTKHNPFPGLPKKFQIRAPEPQNPALTLGRLALKDFSNDRVLDRLLMYERRLEHSLYKTTLELQRLRLIRHLDPPDEISKPRQTKVELEATTADPSRRNPDPSPSNQPEPQPRKATPVRAAPHARPDPNVESPLTHNTTPIQPPSPKNHALSAQNKPNFKNPKNNTTSTAPKIYNNIPLPRKQKNKPNQTQSPAHKPTCDIRDTTYETKTLTNPLIHCTH